MTQEDKYKMGQRIKEEIKRKYNTLKEIGEIVEVKNMAVYTSKKPKEPRVSTLVKLAKAGLDINYIVTGERKKGIIEELEDCNKKNKDYKREIEGCKKEVDGLKVKIYDLMEVQKK
ncbi:MAG: hypothetical protein ABFS12_13980 [Bacteroidota bacterium]